MRPYPLSGENRSRQRIAQQHAAQRHEIAGVPFAQADRTHREPYQRDSRHRSHHHAQDKRLLRQAVAELPACRDAGNERHDNE